MFIGVVVGAHVETPMNMWFEFCDLRSPIRAGSWEIDKGTRVHTTRCIRPWIGHFVMVKSYGETRMQLGQVYQGRLRSGTRLLCVRLYNYAKDRWRRSGDSLDAYNGSAPVYVITHVTRGET
jgi:hypothetical protein